MLLDCCGLKHAFSWLFKRENPSQGMLAVPKAWIEYPTAPPPPPEEMLAQREIYDVALQQRRHRCRLGSDDTPLRALYRIYEAVVLDSNIGLRNEIEYFFRRHTWTVSDIPDPAIPDHPRYAIFACLPYLLLEAFNHNIELGLPRDAPAILSDEEIEEVKLRPKVYESVPDWAIKVPPLSHLLVLPHYETQTGNDMGVLKRLDDERASEVLKAKNILVWSHHIHFI